MSGVCGFVKQRQPGGIDCQTTVQVGGVLLLMNVHDFQYPSLPVVPFHFSCLGALTVHLVLVGPSVGCHPIVGVLFLHRILVLRLNLLLRAWHRLPFHCWSRVSSLHSCASIMSCPLLSTVISVNTALQW